MSVTATFIVPGRVFVLQCGLASKPCLPYSAHVAVCVGLHVKGCCIVSEKSRKMPSKCDQVEAYVTVCLVVQGDSNQHSLQADFLAPEG
jgi:hypothetical protein